MTEYETLEDAREDWENSQEQIFDYEEAGVVVSISEEPESNTRQEEETKYRIVRYFKNHRDNWNVSVDEDRESLNTVLTRYTEIITGAEMQD